VPAASPAASATRSDGPPALTLSATRNYTGANRFALVVGGQPGNGEQELNIGEIAKRAGVSRSTVSYALSGKRNVSEQTLARVQQVIEELNYRPNAAARALKEGRTRPGNSPGCPPADLHAARFRRQRA
jgi:transcriptional regulator with XRE-family HTH domain